MIKATFLAILMFMMQMQILENQPKLFLNFEFKASDNVHKNSLALSFTLCTLQKPNMSQFNNAILLCICQPSSDLFNCFIQIFKILQFGPFSLVFKCELLFFTYFQLINHYTFKINDNNLEYLNLYYLKIAMH
jgi:hypothetical protein